MKLQSVCSQSCARVSEPSWPNERQTDRLNERSPLAGGQHGCGPGQCKIAGCPLRRDDEAARSANDALAQLPTLVGFT